MVAHTNVRTLNVTAVDVGGVGRLLGGRPVGRHEALVGVGRGAEGLLRAGTRQG